ncbi:MAG: adenylate cyclase [Gammaproteobacteria bacterium]
MFSILVGLVLNAVLRIRLLVGPRVLGNFLIGRYYRPRREDRVFMVLDIVDSTDMTERLGDLRAQAQSDIFSLIYQPRLSPMMVRYIGTSVHR